jgi:hypothetical protein
MFEDSVHKTDPITIALWATLIPFALAWIFHNAVWTGFLLQAYIVTFGVFILLPSKDHPDRFRTWRFWKTMLRSGLALHPAFLVTLWFLDSSFPRWFIGGTGTIFLTGILVGALESIILNGLIRQRLISSPAEESRQ